MGHLVTTEMRSDARVKCSPMHRSHLPVLAGETVTRNWGPAYPDHLSNFASGAGRSGITSAAVSAAASLTVIEDAS